MRFTENQRLQLMFFQTAAMPLYKKRMALEDQQTELFNQIETLSRQIDRIENDVVDITGQDDDGGGRWEDFLCTNDPSVDTVERLSDLMDEDEAEQLLLLPAP